MAESVRRRYAPGVARREQLVDAAYALFGETGFGGVSLRAIAARAGISHASLLRYFSSKDEILLALLDRWERENEEWFDARAAEPHRERMVGLARRNAQTRGYVELFSGLSGEATPDVHPAHEHFRRRYRWLRSISAEPAEERIAQAAVWDGLQLLSLYLDEVDVPAELHAYLSGDQATPQDWDVPERGEDAATVSFDLPPERGYAPGRRRRAQIVAGASALFAQRGYAATSMRDIARAVGIAKSTLVHHVSSKEELLEAVLRHRDRSIEEDARRQESSATLHIEDVVAKAAENARRPGHVELYTVLVCEATSPSHPAHDYFAGRYRSAIRSFADLLAASGGTRREAWRSALWLAALWDGLQIQWLYEPAAVDVPAELARFLRRSGRPA